MLKFYCFITGDDYQMVRNETPASKKKIGLLATSLIVPVMLWFINGYMLVNYVLDGTKLAAFATAIIVAFLIFLIERSVIMANGNKFITVFRVTLGLIVALLGSISIDEVIFKDDIDYQVSLNKQEKIKSELAKVNAEFKPQIDDQTREKDKAFNIWQSSLYDVKQEAKGGQGSSGKSGFGRITKLNLQVAKEQKKEFLEENIKLEVIKRNANTKLIEAEKHINTTYKENSLLIRIKAMFDLILSDRWMLAIYILFTTFLFCLEFLVVILKLNLQKTNYERKVELIDHIGNDRMERISQRDNKHFDPVVTLPNVKEAKQEIQKPSPSLFS